LFNFIRLISANPEIHAYAAHKLFASLREDVSQVFFDYYFILFYFILFLFQKKKKKLI